jgi:hypothetical protein
MSDSGRETKEEKLKKMALEYTEQYCEKRIQLELHIDKNKRSVKINKKLFDS